MTSSGDRRGGRSRVCTHENPQVQSPDAATSQHALSPGERPCVFSFFSDTLREGILSNGRLRLVDNQNRGEATPMSTVSHSADVFRFKALTPTGTLPHDVSVDNTVLRRSPETLCTVFEHPSGSDLGRGHTHPSLSNHQFRKLKNRTPVYSEGARIVSLTANN